MSHLGIIDSLLTQECRKYKISRKNSPTKKPVAKKRKRENSDKNKDKPKSPKVSDISNEETQLIGAQTSNNSTESSTKIPFPHITKKNWKAFNEKLFNETIDPENMKIQICLSKMQSRRSENFHFTTCHYVRKTIIDSLLKRDWNILINLLVIFIERYNKPLFMPFIRQVCIV